MARTTKKAAGKKKSSKKKKPSKPQYRDPTAGGGEGEHIPTPSALMRAMVSPENVQAIVEHFENESKAKQRRGEISHQTSGSRNKLVDRGFNRRALNFLVSVTNMEPHHRQNMAITLYAGALALAKMGDRVQKDLFLGGIMPELEEIEQLEGAPDPNEPQEAPPPDDGDDDEGGEESPSEPEPLAAGAIPDNQVPPKPDASAREGGRGLTDEQVRELCEENDVEWDPHDPGGTLKRLDEKLQSQRGGAPAH